MFQPPQQRGRWLRSGRPRRDVHAR
jgi:hypothetical protein